MVPADHRVEHRALATAIRAQGRRLTGYAATFGTPAEIDGRFTETIRACPQLLRGGFVADGTSFVYEPSVGRIAWPQGTVVQMLKFLESSNEWAARVARLLCLIVPAAMLVRRMGKERTIRRLEAVARR